MTEGRSSWSGLWLKEDYWSIWLGLGILILAMASFWAGGSIRSCAVTPGRWATAGELARDLSTNLGAYALLLLGFGAVFAASVALMGHSLRRFLPGFAVLFLLSLAIFYLGSSPFMERWDSGPPLLALIAGLILGNLFPVPPWLREALRTEYYIKTGIVLLGATLPLTLIFTAGPFAFLQATIVSLVTWATIFLAATRLFGLDPRFGAVLGAGGAVCGVSASIAVGGAVKADKDQIAISIAVVSLWAIIMILVLTFLTKSMVPGTISPGVAGAWVGTSEYADAAGFAVVAELAQTHGDAPIRTFTLMKVIGRDIWIGIWAFVLSLVSVLRWERRGGSAGRRSGAGVIWERFPKFVLGFFAASVLMSLVAASPPADHLGRAPVKGTFKSPAQKKAYDGDFSTYRAPAGLAGRFAYLPEEGVITFRGQMTLEELDLLASAARSEDQRWALKELHLRSDWFESVLESQAISPIKKLRSWCFVFCFLSIGLSTRLRELATFGLKPFYAFTIGVLINVPLGYFLSTVVFARFWNAVR